MESYCKPVFNAVFKKPKELKFSSYGVVFSQETSKWYSATFRKLSVFKYAVTWSTRLRSWSIKSISFLAKWMFSIWLDAKLANKWKCIQWALFQFLQEGEVDCWPLLCPNLNCEYTAISEGECCPHCVSDPCLADNITYDIRKTCLDGYGITRLSGAVWTMVGSPCTTCKCKVRWTRLNGNGNDCYYIKTGSFSALGSSYSDCCEVKQTWGQKK